MEKRKLIIILVVFLITGNIVYPNILNKGIGFINDSLKTNFPQIREIPFKLGLDLQGGIHLVYQADLKEIDRENHANAMEGLRDIIARRVDLFGIQEPIVRIQELDGRYRLIVELAGIEDPALAIEMIGETPFLEFKELRDEEETEIILEKIREIQEAENIEEVEDWEIAFQDPYFISTNLTGQYLQESRVSYDEFGRPVISLKFDAKGGELFGQITERNIGNPVGIYIDQEMISSPLVNEKITGGEAIITGEFSLQEARELSRNLNAGALPVPIELISQQSIGPTLGAISLEKSLIAGIFGFLAIVIFVILFYKFSGFLASLTLLFYITLFLSLIKVIPITLTLAGIGGIILSIGMAVDANILIFSRMKEEIKQGKEISYSVEEGFRRSWPSVRDGNLTTLMVAIVLFWFGTSFIQGFALTLSIGILISMFSAFFITKTFLKFLTKTKLTKFKSLWV